jgi:hypothetical protein
MASPTHPPPPPQRAAPLASGRRSRLIYLLLLAAAGNLAVLKLQASRPAPQLGATALLSRPAEQPAAWADERLARYALRESETLPEADRWRLQAQTALQEARTHKRLLFVIATHGDLISGRI